MEVTGLVDHVAFNIAHHANLGAAAHCQIVLDGTCHLERHPIRNARIAADGAKEAHVLLDRDAAFEITEAQLAGVPVMRVVVSGLAEM